MAMGALVEATIFLPVSYLVAIGAERSSAMFLRDGFDVPEEG